MKPLASPSLSFRATAFALLAIASLAAPLVARDNYLLDTSSSNRVLRLAYNWKFSIGDDLRWASPDFDDRDWTEVNVPNPWEDEGYRGYDGYAWYRTEFKTPRAARSDQLFVSLGEIDDVDEVYLNGQLIGATGSFPPNYLTAWNERRTYLIPTELLSKEGKNTLAVRVYDGSQSGGIRSGRIGIYKTDLPKFVTTLDGEWLFHPGDNASWSQPDADTSDFVTIQAPASWESQGYPELDGFAWYRKTFTIDPSRLEGNMVLLLGRIDDLDEVYLNGQKIGSTGNLWEPDQPDDHSYAQHRGYYFPADLLQETNTIAVRVYDRYSIGGIYEGPLAIITQDDYIEFWENRRKSDNIFEDIRDFFE